MTKYIKSPYQFINESDSQKNFSDLYKIAKGVDYDTFLTKTDSLAFNYFLLYRGQSDDILTNNSFMSDYIGHARAYNDENVLGIVADYNDLLRFNDDIFNNLRKKFSKLSKLDLIQIYKPYFKEGKLFNAMIEDYDTETKVIDFVYSFIKSKIQYTKVQKIPTKNDLLIPIMMYYANTLNKNIINFLGNDYADFGGQDEFVVGDISKYITLKSIWLDANKKTTKVLNENNTQVNNDFFVQYNTDRFVSHITSKKRETEILKNGFKTGFELDVSEKRKAIYFSDKDVNYGIYARNKDGETNYGDDIGEVTVNLKGLKLLNMTYKENNKFPNHDKYNNLSIKGELDSIPYNIDGTISFLEDGRIYEVALKKEVANKLLQN